MRSADSMTVDEALDFISDSLRENGIKDVNVTYDQNRKPKEPSLVEDAFSIKKELWKLEIDIKFSVNFRAQNLTTQPEIKKRLAMIVERAAQRIRDEMITTFSWGNKEIDVSHCDGGWAKCKHCGTKVEFQRCASFNFGEVAELSCPKPMPQETESVVAGLSGRDRTLFKLYIIGQLREMCDHNCPNRKYNQKI